ncbi:MAG TPA: hypothetical protein VJR05_15065 [Acidimicrobiia bacterium]|nr:hypothetical protein [Acidimicrobiia bacterium]
MLMVTALLGGSTPSLAQQAPEAGPVQLEASAGVANYVDPRRPVDLALTITAEVFFAGSLEVQQGSSLLVIPVEVPAGGFKTYQAVVPPPVGTTQTRLRLFATGETQPTLSRTLQMKVVTEESLVAVVGAAELAATIDDATVAATEADIVSVVLDESQLGGWLGPARYLVMSPALELSPAVLSWLRAGGRLVVDASETGRLGIDLGAAIPDSRATYHVAGQGRVVAVPNLLDLETDDWSALIQPTPMRFGSRDAWDSPDAQLIGAATNAGDQRVPRLPWLLMAVVGYALLVGPVNFFVLSKLRRRELAWFTVPVLSLLAVATFWVAGRAQLQTTIVNHATVIVGGEVPSARSALALAVGAAGERRVQVPAGWRVYPTAVTSMAGELPLASSPGLLGDDGSFVFDLAQLGAVGLQGTWDSQGVDLPQVTASRDGGEVRIEVENSTSLEFWAWGLVATGRIQVAPDPLAPGARGTASALPGQPGFNEGFVGDAVINARQLWDDQYAWARLSPLGLTATGDLGHVDSYFFGFTDQVEIPVVVNGRTYQARGTSLVVIPLSMSADGELTSLTAQLVDPGDASFIESGPGYLNVSTSEMTVGWWVPPSENGNPRLQVTNIFGELPRQLDAYDWQRGEYAQVNAGQELDLDRFRSPAGDVLLRAGASNDDFPEVFESYMSPYGFALVWNQ